MKKLRAICTHTCILGALLASISLTHAVSVTSRFTGTVFSVPAPNPFGSDLGDVYEMLINYDPDLLAGVAVGEGTSYESPAGASLITFSWTTTGDHFTSDNSFPVTIFIDDEPTGLGGDRDSFSLSGNIDDVTTLRATLFASFGENPLSSENLPTTSADWGDGVGAQWTVQEIFIDRGFDRMSSSISTLEVLTPVPDSGSSLQLLGFSSLLLAVVYHRRKSAESKRA